MAYSLSICETVHPILDEVSATTQTSYFLPQKKATANPLANSGEALRSTQIHQVKGMHRQHKKGTSTHLKERNRHQSKRITAKRRRYTYTTWRVQLEGFRPFLNAEKQRPEHTGIITVLLNHIGVDDPQAFVDIEITVQSGSPILEFD